MLVASEEVGDDVVTTFRHPSPKIHSATRAPTLQPVGARPTIGNYRTGPRVWWKRGFCPFPRFTLNRSVISQFEGHMCQIAHCAFFNFAFFFSKYHLTWLNSLPKYAHNFIGNYLDWEGGTTPGWFWQFHRILANYEILSAVGYRQFLNNSQNV